MLKMNLTPIMAIFIAISLINVSAGHFVFRRQANRCRTPDRKPGNCIPLEECHPLRRMSFKSNKADMSYVRNSICSYDGFKPIVCCPRSNTKPRVPTTESPTDTRIGRLTNEECGISASPDPRIISGQPASLNAWPWMVAIFDEQFGQVFFRCGGTLINRQYVLTAAHCVADRFGPIPPSKFTLRFGDLNLVRSDDGASPIEMGVSEIKIYEGYDFTLSQPVMHDIALMRLSRPVTYSKSIRPICLPGSIYDRVSVFERKSPFVIGWGKTENGTDSDILRQVQLPIQRQQDCQNVYPNLPIGPTHICAGLPRGGKDSCQGDSGGPLMLTDFENANRRSGPAPFILAGIVSTGAQCARPGFFGIYTRVTAYRDWIEKNIG